MTKISVRNRETGKFIVQAHQTNTPCIELFGLTGISVTFWSEHIQSHLRRGYNYGCMSTEQFDIAWIYSVNGFGLW